MTPSSVGGDEPSLTHCDASESDQNDLYQAQLKGNQSLRAGPVDFTLEFGLDENKQAYVGFSGHAPLVWREPIDHRRMSLTDFRRALGYRDSQFADDTEALQCLLRANPSHDPTESTNTSDPRARLESRMTPDDPKYYQLVPDLLSLEVALQARSDYSIDKTFDLDHQGGFIVYKVGATGDWTLLHALVAALTIEYPSHKFSVLDLYYYYKKAVENEPVNKVSSVGFVAPAKTAAYNCTFDWDMTAQAMDSYMEHLGFAPHIFVVVQPSKKKTAPLSRIFTIPCAIQDSAVAQMRRVWIMHTANADHFGPHFNVVLRYNTKLSHSLRNTINEVESQQNLGYINMIRGLEIDLMDRNVSMTSLTLEETQELFRENEAARNEHMSRPGFGANAMKPSRFSQRPNYRKQEMVPTPSRLVSESDSELQTGNTRHKFPDSNPKSLSVRVVDDDDDTASNGSADRPMELTWQFPSSPCGSPRPSSLFRTPSPLGSEDSGLDEAVEMVVNTSHSLKSCDEFVVETLKSAGNDTKRPRTEGNYEEDTIPPNSKRIRPKDESERGTSQPLWVGAGTSAPSVRHDDPLAGLKRPRPKPLASAEQTRHRNEYLASSKHQALGFDDINWRPS